MLGSLTNSIMENTAGAKPEVGMGVTFIHWSDRSAGTIVSVSESGKSIEVRGDKTTRTDSNGMSESQTYEFETVDEGPTATYTLRKNGRWVRQGEDMKGSSILVGVRSAYYDYSF